MTLAPDDTRHVHGAWCDLLAALDLTHGTPVLEWHTYDPDGTPAVPGSDTPYGSTWRVLTGTWDEVSGPDAGLAATYSATSYDDSAWDDLPLPIAKIHPTDAGYPQSPDNPWPPYATFVPTFTDLWMRRQLPAGATITIRPDADVWVYWNGTLLNGSGGWTSTSGIGTIYERPSLTAGDGISTLSLTGAGVLVIYAHQHVRGGTDGLYVDVHLDGTDDTPGTDPGWTIDEDRTGALAAFRAGHGRTNALEATTPLWSEVILSRALLTGALPTVGERFRITLNADVAAALGVDEDERPRFTGEITDHDVEHRRGNTTYIRVAGAGRSGRLSRVPLDAERPQELDGDRARRILYKAALTLPVDVGTIDPGTVEVLAEDYAGKSAAAALDQLRVDSLGQLVEHRSGRLEWHDAEHRRGLPSLATLTGDEHLITPFRWSQTIANLVNDADVGWGVEQRARVTDAPSVAQYGPYGVQLDTRLAAAADAHALASTIVGRYGQPTWVLPALSVDLVRTALSVAGALLELTHGDKITATDLPPDGPFTAGDLFVEGTAEEWDQGKIRISLNASDPRIAGVGIRWIDVDPLLQWEDVDPALTWLDATTVDAGDVGTPDLEVDGGTPSTSSWDLSYDGGDPTTSSWDLTLDGSTP